MATTDSAEILSKLLDDIERIAPEYYNDSELVTKADKLIDDLNTEWGYVAVLDMPNERVVVLPMAREADHEKELMQYGFSLSNIQWQYMSELRLQIGEIGHDLEMQYEANAGEIE